jgi:putative DNA primase/helicase
MSEPAPVTRTAALTRIMDNAKGAMALASDRKAELAIIAYAAGAIERHGDDGSDALGDLSNYAIDIRGISPDAVQAAIVRGVGIVLDERATADTGAGKVVPLRPGQPDKKPQRSLKFVNLADIHPEPVRWLWPDRIARKLVLFTGLPDCGKTTAAIDIVARVTTGREWPDGSGRAPHGSVIFMTAEDGLADTIRPRADAAGADVSRVHCLDAVSDEHGRPGTFDLTQDLALLAEKVREVGDVALVVIDPISAYMGSGGKVDTHKAADVRAVLSPLKDFSDKHGVAVLGLTHPPKSIGKAMDAVVGSQGFVAAARAAWMFVRETDDDGNETGRTLMLPVKNNLSKERNNGLAYQILTAANGWGFTAWDAEPVTISADKALAPDGGGRRASMTDDAAKFLEELLKDGSVTVARAEEEARAAGLLGAGQDFGQSKPFRRARERLRIETHRLSGADAAEGSTGWVLCKR